MRWPWMWGAFTRDGTERVGRSRVKTEVGGHGRGPGSPGSWTKDPPLEPPSRERGLQRTWFWPPGPQNAERVRVSRLSRRPVVFGSTAPGGRRQDQGQAGDPCRWALHPAPGSPLS